MNSLAVSPRRISEGATEGATVVGSVDVISVDGDLIDCSTVGEIVNSTAEGATVVVPTAADGSVDGTLVGSSILAGGIVNSTAEGATVVGPTVADGSVDGGTSTDGAIVGSSILVGDVVGFTAEEGAMVVDGLTADGSVDGASTDGAIVGISIVGGSVGSVAGTGVANVGPDVGVIPAAAVTRAAIQLIILILFVLLWVVFQKIR